MYVHDRHPRRFPHPDPHGCCGRHRDRRGRGPVGLCQRRGASVEMVRAGDCVFFEPDEEHWHGAAPDRFMTHIAMQEADDSGSPVSWGEHVSDAEYETAPVG